jgi:hypothetical protein
MGPAKSRDATGRAGYLRFSIADAAISQTFSWIGIITATLKRGTAVGGVGLQLEEEFLTVADTVLQSRAS